MATVNVYQTHVTLHLTPTDTEEWANRPGARWPCSTLSGRGLFASFDRNGLVDLLVEGWEEGDVPANELNAIASDYLRAVVPLDHPTRFVAVDQFN